MSESISQTALRLTSFIQQVNPQADTSPGSAVSELVIKLAATLQNEIYNDITALSQVSSVQQALASTTPTYTTTIDEIASNYNTNRVAGSYSTGNIQIFLASPVGIVIPQGATFVQSNLNLTYTTTQTYSYGTNANSTNGLLPIYTQGSTYYIILPVQATTVGIASQVTSGTQFTLSGNYTNSNIVSLSAYGNFSLGANQDSDQVLISKFQTRLANSTFFSEASINNYLTNNFSGFQQVSVVGSGDVEMLRDKENLFGIATFGMSDIYVRTSESSTITISQVGTKLATGIWSMNIANNVCPGFYNITSIQPAAVNNVINNTAGTLVINSTTYGYAPIPTSTRQNQIGSLIDSRFSSYQNAVVNFQYNDPGLAIGATANFNVTFAYQPNILPIQMAFLNDSTRPISADYLVKACIPAFCSFNITLAKLNSTDTPTSVGIPNLQQQIYNYINSLKFGDAVAASDIIQLCQNLPIARTILPISMSAQIFAPSGATLSISSQDELVIPTDMVNGVSPNITSFFVDYFTSISGQNDPIQNIVINLV